MSESMNSYISIIDDINRESLNPTKDMWTETRHFNVKPVEQKT